MTQCSNWPIYSENDSCVKFWNREECSLNFDISICYRLQKTDCKNQIIKDREYFLTNDGLLFYQKETSIRWVQLSTRMSVKLIDLKLQNKQHDLVKVIRIKRNSTIYLYFWSIDYQETFTFFKRLTAFCVCSNFEQLYTIQDLMGKGGFSKVYKLSPVNKQPNQHQFYAGKIYNRNEMIQKKDFSTLPQMIRTECEILKKINSPFVMALYEIIQLDEQLILITELLKCGSLYRLLKEKVRIPENEATGIILRIALGLQTIHNLGYVHRDIKLENILMDSNQVKIVDFGFAEQINREQLTSGQGTAGYMAPEIFQNIPYTELGDVFSLGVVYYILLTGKPPFKGNNQETICRANKQCEVDFSEYCFVNVSQKTIQLVKGMMQKYTKLRTPLGDVIQQLLNQNLQWETIFRSISFEGSQLTKPGDIRSLYIQQSQHSQDSLKIQQQKPKRVNITQQLDKLAVKISSFRPSLPLLESYRQVEQDDLEDNTLPQQVLAFLSKGSICLNNPKFH